MTLSMAFDKDIFVSEKLTDTVHLQNNCEEIQSIDDDKADDKIKCFVKNTNKYANEERVESFEVIYNIALTILESNMIMYNLLLIN